ncbi:hypothetical protein C1645_831540 [Glomus cerebriforme]|uniref:Uncharacterized protein n=1 Tax=Glomus cerebriforme TaxID=658196 RepID=A0A397SQM4_9GLOM|nr:hypothetical protein C1645_831540 [Glomus cerebriforme]
MSNNDHTDLEKTDDVEMMEEDFGFDNEVHLIKLIDIFDGNWSMGLIGGAWGLAAAMYSLLLVGADTLRPWGIVQLYCCGVSRLTRNKLKKSLPTIPFFNTDIKNNPPIHDLSLDEKIELIQNITSVF